MSQTIEKNVLDEDVDLNPHDLDVGRLAGFAALALGVFHFWASWSGGPPLLKMRSIHIGGVMIVLWLVLLHQSKNRRNPLVIGATTVAIALSTWFMALVYFNDDEILRRFTKAPDGQLWLGLAVMLICLEASRRVMGAVLPAIVIASGAIVLFADRFSFLDELIISVDSKDLINTLAFSTNGLFGSITGTSAGVIASFLILGSFLTASGGSQSFLNLARFLVGRFKGGPAKVSLLTSALFGTVSGSAVANVVVDGVFNIPLMKRSGYRPEFAAAVEANASTGGQLVPPVMGSAAFIMAEMLGIPFSRVLIAAIIPAALFYLALLITCHVEALKLGLPAIPKKQLPKASTLITREFLGSFAVPLTVLMVYLYVFHRSLLYASWAATVTVILYMLTLMPIPFKERLRKIVDAFRLSGIEIARIGAIVVAAQLMVAIMGISGIGPRIANELAGRDLPLALTLLILGITVILIGFPLPTAPAYILAASVANPLFAALGIDMLAGHLFLLYFAVYGNVTPPVMPSVYPAAAIARCDSMKAGWEASRLLAPAMLVPFAFVLDPELLITHGTSAGIVMSTLRMSIGILFVSCGLAFWALRPLPRPAGIMLALAGALVAWPALSSTVVGGVLAVIALLPALRARRSEDGQARSRRAGVLPLDDSHEPVLGEDWQRTVGCATAVYELRDIGPSSTLALGSITDRDALAAALGAPATGATVVLAPPGPAEAVVSELLERSPDLVLGSGELVASLAGSDTAAATWENFADRVAATAPSRAEAASESTWVALLGTQPGDRSAVVRRESAEARRRRIDQMAGSFGFTVNDRVVISGAMEPWWVLAFAEAALHAEAVVAITPDIDFDPVAWLDAVAKTEATTVVLNTAQLGQIVDHCSHAGVEAPESIVAVIHGGDPCEVEIKRAAIDLFGPILVEFSGTADLMGTMVTCEDWLEDVDSLGRSWNDDIEVYAVDHTGTRLPAGQRGRIALAWKADDITVHRIDADGTETVVDVEHPYISEVEGTVGSDGVVHVPLRLSYEGQVSVLLGSSPERASIAASLESIERATR